MASYSSYSRPSRSFRRSMTPSASVKMTPSRFNLVCGKTRETAITPNVSQIPRTSYPTTNTVEYKTGVITTPSYHTKVARDRSVSVTRGSSITRDRPPVAPVRDSSLYLPFGSYAELGVHTKPPSKYAAGVSSAYGSAYNRDLRKRSVTPGPSFPAAGPIHQASYHSQASSRRSSQTFTSQSFTRRTSFSLSVGTPSAARGVCSY